MSLLIALIPLYFIVKVFGGIAKQDSLFNMFVYVLGVVLVLKLVGLV
jgi:NADH:ubiquinone oxidoreductase subunit 4 (subunit M)